MWEEISKPDNLTISVPFFTDIIDTQCLFKIPQTIPTCLAHEIHQTFIIQVYRFIE